MIQLWMEKHLKNHQAGNILDVGPGYGDFSRIAARTTCARRLVYWDFDTAVLQFQRDRSLQEGYEVECHEALLEVELLKNVKEKYDLILCQEVLEHLNNAEEILSTLTHKLTDSGLMLITVPTALSESWLKFINPAYMKDEPFGHVRKFNKKALLKLIDDARLTTHIILPTQPHYFISHTWLFGTRMEINGSSGEVKTRGFRYKIHKKLLKHSRRIFQRAPIFWGKLLPRNYFVVAGKGDVRNANRA